MKLSDFDYQFPPRLVAQFPLEDRSAARLLVVDRLTGNLAHKRFSDITDYLKPSDVLVFNNTKVIPARVFGNRTTGGRVEILLVRARQKNLWECLVRPGRRLRFGEKIVLSNGIDAEVRARLGSFYEIRFSTDEDISSRLDEIGFMPLPHYVKREAQSIDREYYQTVYAEKEGSIAAPTAGLHFTKSLIDAIEAKGVALAKITLSIGPGTFLPIHSAAVEQHKMDSERYEISDEAKTRIENAKRVIAVGTSSVRVLETVTKNRQVMQQKGSTDLFIFPGHQFGIVDALITNFHLPKGTPLLLTAAFAGKELLFRAYQEAIKLEYRLFSYGDAMLIL